MSRAHCPMSFLWSKKVDQIQYRVTQAGHSLRLYRNGVLHSQWNPAHAVRGSLWDLFLLTSFNPRHDVRRVLVLGAGGGAVINLVHHFFPESQIDAIDSDSTHLYVAKKFFKVDVERCSLIQADASSWLEEKSGREYDLIIDDIFSEVNRVPFRSVSAESGWVKRLLRLLTKDGVLVMNFADQKEWRNCRESLAVEKRPLGNL